MVKTLAVDSNNDLFIGASANLAVVTGLNATLQTCAHAAKAQLGEMVLAVNRGIPNFQTIWKGAPNFSQFENALRNALRNVNGVIEVLDVEITVTDNILSYTATISTIFGEGVINAGL